jgi:hypothetical protein
MAEPAVTPIVYGAGTCALPGCGRPIREGILMCGKHWMSVPDYLRNAVYVAMHTYNRGLSPLSSLRAAQDAAIAAAS